MSFTFSYIYLNTYTIVFMAVKHGSVSHSINTTVGSVYSYINPNEVRVYISINTECKCLRYIATNYTIDKSN